MRPSPRVLPGVTSARASSHGIGFMLLLLFAVAPSVSAAGVFYVNGSSPTCSASGPGTEANPYCSITAALNAVAGPGTTISVKPGVYREQVSIPASGTAGSPLVIEALGGTVVVDGANDYSGSAKWVQNSTTVWYTTGVSTPPLHVFKNGIRLSAASGDYKKLPANSYRYEPNKSRLHVNAGGGNPGLHQILVGARNSGFILTGRSWVEIRNVTVTRAQQRGIVIQGGSSNLTLRGNAVTWCLGNGVHLDGGAGHVLAASTVSDNGDHGILVGGGATGCRIEDNECFRNIDLASKRANGIHSTGASSNRYERNRLHDNQDSGLQLQSGSNNNLSIQNIAWLNGDHGFHDTNATGNAHIGDVASANVQDGFSLDANATGTRIVNCIAVNNGATTSRFNLRLDAGSTVGFISDDNMFWNAAGHIPVSYGGTAYATLAAFAAASGTDARTIQDDPRFVNPQGGDFMLLAGSRAIDAANSGTANWPATDALGRARMDDPATPNSGSGPVPYADRGAHEFVAVGVAPVAFLTVTPSSGTAPLAVTASASGSYDSDAGIMSYRFDFGDGAVAGPQSGMTAGHTYSTPGTYAASVTVRSSDGGTASATRVVDVNGSNQVPNGTIDTPASNVAIVAGQSVSFSGSGFDPDGNFPLAYAWNFGGGAANQTVEDPGSVTFAGIGTYTVTLTVSDALGAADPTPASRVITVNGSGSGTADEVHWTIVGQTAVSFDWRGSANSIRYGTSPALGQTVAAVTPSPAPFSSSEPYWEARITGLKENTLYYYSIGGGSAYTFRTPPPRGSSGFVAYAQGDIGDSASYRRVVPCQTLIADAAPDLVLGLGDMTYGNAHGLASVDNHFNDVMKWSRTSPYMPAWGNHEWDDPTRDDLRNYKGRFDFPNPQASSGAPIPGCCGEDWYWYDYGNVRFIIYPEPYTSATWTDWRTRATTLMDQAQADPQIRWIVTYGHRPAYSSGHHPGLASLKTILDALGDTHSKYVLNLNGHSHNYERSYPQHGVVHVTAGASGSTLEQDGTCLWLTCAQPSWSAFRAMRHSVVRLVVGANTLAIEAICGPEGDLGSNRNDIACTQGSVFDRYVISDVANVDRAPVAASPATVSGAGGSQVTVQVTAADPDGDAITSLAMDASSLPSPNNAVFTAGSGNTSGTFTWTPSAANAGTWSVRFRATNALVGPEVATAITIANGDRAPVVAATPETQIVNVGEQAVVEVSAFDPDNDPIRSLTAVTGALPAGHGATFAAVSGNLTGTLRWTPSANDTGNFVVGFTASNVLSASTSATIRVNPGPIAALTAVPSTGTAPLAVTLDASGSVDADGAIASYLFSFGDGEVLGPQSSPNANHLYEAGNWTPSVIVTDARGARDTALTAVTVSPAAGGTPNLCGNPSFESSASGWTSYQGTTLTRVASASAHDGGYVMRMAAPAILRGNDGINDSPSWIRTTPAAGTRYRFNAWVRSATSTSTSRIQLREYLNGARVGAVLLTPAVSLSPDWKLLSADFTCGAAGSYIDFQVMATPTTPGEEFETDDISIHRLAAAGPHLARSADAGSGVPAQPLEFAPVVTPNPSAGSATLSFVLPKPGELTIRIYDTTGRIVHTLMDRAMLSAGRHMLPIGRSDRDGRSLNSGIYHYIVEFAHGVRTGRFAIIR